MSTLTEQLDAMLTLKPNWDGYGADPTDSAVVPWAKELVGLLTALERRAGTDWSVRVYPTRVGGVQIEWSDATHDRELELDPDGTVGMLHIERASGRMHEESFRPGGWAVAPGFIARVAEFAASPMGAVA